MTTQDAGPVQPGSLFGAILLTHTDFSKFRRFTIEYGEVRMSSEDVLQNNRHSNDNVILYRPTYETIRYLVSSVLEKCRTGTPAV